MSAKPGQPVRQSQKRLMAESGYLPALLVARSIGVAHTTVNRWCDSVKFPTKRIGTARYVQLRGLRAFLTDEIADKAGLTEGLLVQVAQGKVKP